MNLLKWGKDRLNNVENIVSHPAADIAQLNPLDGNRTYQTVTQQGAAYSPAPNQSVVQQATHNGATNFAGAIVKPLIRSSMAINQGIGNAELKLAGRPTQNAQQYAQATGIPHLQNFTGYTGTKSQILGDAISNTSNLAFPASSKVVKGAFNNVAPKIVPKIINRAVANAGVGAVVGGVSNLGSALSNDNIKSVQDVRNAVKTGATTGAVLGAGGTLALPAVKAGLSKVKPVPTSMPVSTPRVSVAEQNVLRDHTDMLNGVYNPQGAARNSLIAQARQIGAKHSVNLTTGSVADRIDRTNQILDTVGQKGRSSLFQDQSGHIAGSDPLPTPPRIPGGKQTAQPGKQVVSPKISVSSSQKPVKAGGLVEAPKTSPQQVSALPTPETAPPVQPGLRNVKERQITSPTESQLVPAQPQSVVFPSSNTTPKRGFVQSVNNSPEVSPTVAGRASGTYKVRNTAQLESKANTFASKNLNKATEAVSSSLGRKRGNISDQEVANAIAVAKRHDANNNHAQATDIYENLAKHLTAQGQSIQAASLLDHRTPEGLRYQITKVFKKAGVTPSKEVNDLIDAKMKDIKGTKSGTPERILAVKQLQKIVGDNLPSSVTDKAISFWKAGLLTGARTQSGNLLSNETFSILHNVSNPLAVGLDKGISLVTGQRSKALTGRGLLSGTGEGTKRGVTYLKTGIDERAALTNKFDSHQVNFKNKALNTYVNGVFRLMGAADRPHYYRQLENTLNDLAIVDGKNLGLTGKALRDHANKFVKDPPQNAFQLATNEAEKAVLGNDTILSKAISKLRSAAESAESPLGKAVTEASINLLMPFTKVPSAFISRVVDYTPVGAIKTIAGQVSRGKFDQRAFVTAISEATTGTGLMYLGYKLAQNNMLSGDYPTDPKEQQRWKANGIQPNSIKIDGHWINMNYAGPIGLLFSAGGRISDTKNQGGSWAQQQAQVYAGMPKSLMQQSFLQGLSGATQAINEPGRYANNYVKSQAGSLVPTLVGDAATATDTLQRAANTPLEAIKNRLPGARETLNPAQDVYGNNLPRKTGPVSTMINPLRPTTDMGNKNPVISEVNRLHGVDPTNTDLAVTPVPVPKTIKVEGNSVTLNNNQRYGLQKFVGQTIQANWGKLIQTSAYRAMNDTEKAKALTNMRTDSTTWAERQYVTQNGLGSYTKPVTSSVASLANGDMSKYTGTAKTTKPSVKTSTKKTSTKTTSRKTTGSTRTASTKTANKTAVSKLASVVAAANKKSPFAAPTKPNFTVKTPSMGSYKKANIKRYAVKKSSLSTGKKTA